MGCYRLGPELLGPVRSPRSDPNPFGIRSSRKHACNPFGMNASKGINILTQKAFLVEF